MGGPAPLDVGFGLASFKTANGVAQFYKSEATRAASVAVCYKVDTFNCSVALE